MCAFDEDAPVEHLPATTYRELVDELNKESRWIPLAERLAELVGLGTSWIRSLTQEGNGTPAERLLVELSARMCTLGILCTLLESCGSHDVLSIFRTEPLAIVEQPNCKIGDGELEVALGEHLRMSCEATGLPPPKYEWYQDNVELTGENKNQLSILVTRYRVKATARESVTFLSPALEGEYRCNVTQTSRDGRLTTRLVSEALRVKVKSTPVAVKEQPLPYVEIGERKSIALSCKAEGHPVPRYQWYRGNTRLNGCTSDTLRIDSFTAEDEGKYRCYVFNPISEMYTRESSLVLELPRQRAAAKIALLIANDEYENLDRLRTPKSDAAKIARLLSQIGFKVVCLANLTTVQMRNAMKIFCDALSRGAYGLFYFAGHGFKMQESYMLSVDAPEKFLRKDAICESLLLSVALERDPALLVVVLDTCQIVPSKESNPDIYRELPVVYKYKCKKNLIQAYSTSSQRPSFETTTKDCGLYVTHLSKYIDQDIPVAKVFAEVGRSIDAWLKGAERDQIPIFALTVTKPYRLTDAIQKKSSPSPANDLNRLIAFPTKEVGITFEQSAVQCKVIISPAMEHYLNLVRLDVTGAMNYNVQFHNSTPVERNNLRSARDKECEVQNPQNCKGPLLITLHENEKPVGIAQFAIMDHVPLALKMLNG